MLIDSRLSITFQTGVDEFGEPVYRTKNFNNVKETATDAQLKAVADAFAPLQQHAVAKVERYNTHDLVI